MTTPEYLQREIRRTELSVRRAERKPNTPQEELRGLHEKLEHLQEAMKAVEELARVTEERDALRMNPPVEIQADAFALAVELAKVTAERDAAVEQLHGYCFACKHYTPYHNDGLCATCKHERACFKPWDAVDRWQWRGPQKEE